MKHEQNYAISFIRLVALLLVLCCHMFEWIGYTLGRSEPLGVIGNYCAVGVQIFLILSGYLYGRRDTPFASERSIHFIFRNCKKVLLDYYIYVLLIIIPVYYYLAPESISFNLILGLLTCSQTISGVHHLWYIPYILLCYLLFPLIYDIKKYFEEKLAWGNIKKTLLVIGIFFFTELIGKCFDSYFTFTWINCFILGCFLHGIISNMSCVAKRFATFAIVILSIVLNCYNYNVRYKILPLYNEGLEYDLCNYFINYTRLISALAMFIVLYFVGNHLFKKNNANYVILLYSDKYSYDIYITHMIFIKGVLSLLNITPFVTINAILTITLTFVSAFLLRTISKSVSDIFTHKEKRCIE